MAIRVLICLIDKSNTIYHMLREQIIIIIYIVFTIQPNKKALSTRGTNTKGTKIIMDGTRFELVTSCMRSKRSPNWANRPKKTTPFIIDWMSLGSSNYLALILFCFSHWAINSAGWRVLALWMDNSSFTVRFKKSFKSRRLLFWVEKS